MLQFTLLKKFPKLEHGIATRHNERQQTYDVVAEQVHGNRFAWVDGPRLQPVPRVDALLTGTPGVRLRIGTSDCVPIIVYDPSTQRGGVIHAGLKGTTQDILWNVLQEFNPTKVYLGIGPAIGPECYDAIDIQRENVWQALEAGVPKSHIEVMRLCTKCHNDTFYSYRAGDTVNFGSYFLLNPTPVRRGKLTK